MPSSPRTVAFPAAVLALLILLSGCDNHPNQITINPPESGRIEVSQEVRRLLPKGAYIYYTKGAPNKDLWSVYRLDLWNGTSKEIISTDTTGLIGLQARSISTNNNSLLVSGYRPGSEEDVILDLKLPTNEWRKLTNAVSAIYSPDGRNIAIYGIPSNIDTLANITPLAVSIFNSETNETESIPCRTTRCLHPFWLSNYEIVFVDGLSIRKFNLKTRSISDIYKFDHKIKRLGAFAVCNNTIYAPIVRKDKNTEIRELIKLSLDPNAHPQFLLEGIIEVTCAAKPTLFVTLSNKAGTYPFIALFNPDRKQLIPITENETTHFATGSVIYATPK